MSKFFTLSTGMIINLDHITAVTPIQSSFYWNNMTYPSFNHCYTIYANSKFSTTICSTTTTNIPQCILSELSTIVHTRPTARRNTAGRVLFDEPQDNEIQHLIDSLPIEPTLLSEWNTLTQLLLNPTPPEL